MSFGHSIPDHLEAFGYAFGCPAALGPEFERARASISSTFAAQRMLWDALCAIEAESRAAWFAAAAADDSVARAQAALAEAEGRLAAALALPKGQRPKLAPLAERIKWLKAEARAQRKSAAARLRPQLDAIEAKRRDAVKRAVAESGLWWAHHEVVAMRYDAARKRAMKIGATLRPHRPDDTDGTLRVRWSNGIPAAKLLAGGDSLARLDFERRIANGRYGYRLTLCIESAERAKDYVTVPIVMSRELPPECSVRTIALFPRRRGDTVRWKGAITVQRPRTIAAPRPSLPALVLDRTWLADDEPWRRAMAHVKYLRDWLDRAALDHLERVGDADLARIDALRDSRKGTVGYLHVVALDGEETAAFRAATRRRSVEARALSQRAIRRRDERYRRLARELCAEHGLIRVEKIAALAFEAKTPDRPAWGRFVEILRQAAQRSGTTIEFFAAAAKEDVDAAAA